jgi:hypothetical protein
VTYDAERRDAILAAADPVDVVMMLFDQVQQRIVESGIETLTSTELFVFCMWDLVLEVNNGGFSQFFFNSSGDRATETLAALHAIDAPQTAALLARAIAHRDVAEVLAEVDRAFYAEPEPLWALTAAYCRAHRDDLRVTAPPPAA